MENQFANQLLNEFFMKQDSATRLGILEYYCHEPPEGMFLFWAASHDERLSEKAQRASILLDEYFLTNKNNYVSFELAHRQAAKLFKRLYLDRNVSMPKRRTRTLHAGRTISTNQEREETPVGDQ